MNLVTYRRRVLDTLRDARGRWPHAHLFVLYAPGDDDPLDLAGPCVPRREGTLLADGLEGRRRNEPPAPRPRLIALDCRRLAAGAVFLEDDPAFDDPLLEASISLSWEDPGATGTAPGEDPDAAPAVCGWLVSPDPARDIVARLDQAACAAPPARRHGVRWHDPRRVALLWPTLEAAQRLALLGPRLVWVARDGAGQLVRFEADAQAVGEAPTPATAPRLREPQWQRAERLGLIRQLVAAWRDHQAQPLPADAVERLHRHVERGAHLGLRGRDLIEFVFAAMALGAGFKDDPRMRAVLRATHEAPGTFGDHLDTLPAEFWALHAQAGAHPAREVPAP